MAFSGQLIPCCAPSRSHDIIIFIIIIANTHLRLLVDSRMRSRICWWEEPSMLTPLMVTMMSPEKEKDEIMEKVEVSDNSQAAVTQFFIRSGSTTRAAADRQPKGFFRLGRSLHTCGRVLLWLTCGQTCTLGSAVLVHPAHERAHFRPCGVFLLQTVGLQSEKRCKMLGEGERNPSAAAASAATASSSSSS